MQKMKFNFSRFLSIFLLIGALLSVSMGRVCEPAQQKQISISDPVDAHQSEEIIFSNIVFEAVIPFLHVDFFHHFVIIPFPIFSNYSSDYLLLFEPQYINKYLKNLFLFIISPNAP